MPEIPSSNSFIVRIYRIDTADARLISGLVEPMDGSGDRESFTDLEGLADVLNRSVAKQQKTRRRTPGMKQTSRKRQERKP